MGLYYTLFRRPRQTATGLDYPQVGGCRGDWLLIAAEQSFQIIASGDGGKTGYHVVGNEASAQPRQELTVFCMVVTGADDHEKDVRS